MKCELRETHSRAGSDFINSLRREFAGEYDYIEGIDSKSSEGLDHLDGYEDAVNENPLEVAIGFPGINDMTMDEFEKFDTRVESLADREGVSVESTAGNGDYIEYTFYLHNRFLTVPGGFK